MNPMLMAMMQAQQQQPQTPPSMFGQPTGGVGPQWNPTTGVPQAPLRQIQQPQVPPMNWGQAQPGLPPALAMALMAQAQGGNAPPVSPKPTAQAPGQFGGMDLSSILSSFRF